MKAAMQAAAQRIRFGHDHADQDPAIRLKLLGSAKALRAINAAASKRLSVSLK